MNISLFLGTGPCWAAAVGSTLAVVGAAASLLRTRSCRDRHEGEQSTSKKICADIIGCFALCLIYAKLLHVRFPTNLEFLNKTSLYLMEYIEEILTQLKKWNLMWVPAGQSQLAPHLPVSPATERESLDPSLAQVPAGQLQLAPHLPFSPPTL